LFDRCVHFLQNQKQEMKTQDIALLTAVLLPPLSVYLTVKEVSNDRKVVVTNVVVCFLLCLVFWVPGVVFASCITCFDEVPILFPIPEEEDCSEGIIYDDVVIPYDSDNSPIE